MSKEEFIKKYSNGNHEFVSDFNSVLVPVVHDVDDYYDDEEDDWDKGMDDEDRREQEYEEQCERAFSCKCGAYQFKANGNPVHVADCICGAD